MSAQTTAPEAPRPVKNELEDWQSLVDVDRLTAWMDAQGLERGPILDAARPPGGTQNLLLKFRRGDRWFMLRRPPRHPTANGGETMRREARVLRALADSDVPHPRLIAAADDDSVIGVPFYLMEPIDGFNATVGLPALHAGSPEIRHGMGLAMADGIAALGRVDVSIEGLRGLGKPEGFLERQVPRWLKQLDGYRIHEGWPGPAEIPGIEVVGEWLEANRPKSFKPGLIHGDYHLANVLFRFDGPKLAAIVDWELTTIGDPLLDIGGLLATWPEPDANGEFAVAVQPWEGFPTGAELVERYAAQTDRDMSHIDWYAVLACFKLGIILEGTYARAAAGKADPVTGERLHAQTVSLFRKALRRIGREA